MIHIKKLVILIILHGIFGNAYSQADKELIKTKELYPNAEIVCSQLHCAITISIEKGKPVIHYSNLEEFYFLGDNNAGYANRSINYSSFYDLKKYQAHALVLTGSKYKKVAVKEFQSNDFTNNNIFHDDSKELKFMFQRIGKGDKTNISYEYQINDPHLIPYLSISPYLNYVNVLFTVSYPEGVELKIDTFFMGKSQLNYQIKKSGKITTVSWTGQSNKYLEYESDGPERAFVSPQVHVRIKSYTIDDKTTKVLSNLDDLYTWNCELAQQSKEDFTQFKNLSDSIVGNEKDPLKKASLLFSWVQNNIRYIAIETGYDGLIPAKASEVCKERYGDCKGMSNILFNLLRSQNLEAYLTWIGTRDLPYKYSELHSPAVDNHMITALKINGEYLFLDATSSNLKFGMPSPFIQGKEALISSMNCKDYTVKVVPETPGNDNKSVDSCYMKLNNRTIIGSGIATLTGYKRLGFVDRLSDRSYRTILEQSRYYLLKGNNRFVLDTVWIDNMEEKNLPLIIHYKFQIPDYAVKVDNEYYLNLNLDKSNISQKVDADRNVALEYRYKTAEQNTYCLELGPNITIENLPVTTELKQANYYFKNSYLKNNQILVRKQELYKETLMLETNQFAEYNKLIETMQKSYSEQITLIQK